MLLEFEIKKCLTSKGPRLVIFCQNPFKIVNSSAKNKKFENGIFRVGLVGSCNRLV